MITVYHTTASNLSRKVLAFLEYIGESVTHTDLLRQPPQRDALCRLINCAGLTPRQILRQKGTPYQSLGLHRADKTDDMLIDAMLAHPMLINQPLVETETIVRLCRPADLILDVYPEAAAESFTAADGTPFLKDMRISQDLEALKPAFRSVGLPPPDTFPPPCQFYAFHTLTGALCGYAVMDIRDRHALIPAIVIAPMYRGTALVRSLTAILHSRAIMAGADRAWLTTNGVHEAEAREGFERTAPPLGEPLPTDIRTRLPPAYGMGPEADLLSRVLFF